MAQESIWPGSSSYSSGDTPWGFYDADNEFSPDVDKFSTWAGRRLGYPIMSNFTLVLKNQLQNTLLKLISLILKIIYYILQDKQQGQMLLIKELHLQWVELYFYLNNMELKQV